MNRTIDYPLTSELWERGDVARDGPARVLLAVLWAVCGCAALTAWMAMKHTGFGDSPVWAVAALAAGLLATYVHIVRLMLRRRAKHDLPVQYRVTFTDIGFHVSPGPDQLVKWDEVRRVQSTAALWMVDFLHEGQARILPLPSELVDTELATFIRDRTEVD